MESKYIEIGVGLLGNVDSGKCLGKGTLVLMSDGRTKPIEEVWFTDLLVGDDNKIRKVTEVVMGKSQLYKITLGRNGGEYVVNDKHILSFKQTNIETISVDNQRKSWMCRWWEGIKIKSRRFQWGENQEEAYLQAAKFMNDTVPKIPGYTSGGSIVDIQIEDYLRLTKQVSQNLYGYKVPYHLAEKEVKLDPYIMGVWLGDGTSSKPQITNIDIEVIEAFENYIIKLGLHIARHGSKYGYYASAGNSKPGSNSLTCLLREYNVFKNKHIPDDYKYNCPEVQLQLLAGLIDTDGSYEKGTFVFTQKDKKMVEDVQFISRSLGFWASMGNKWNEKYKTMYYWVSIVGPLNRIPTRIKRKQAHPRLSKVGYNVAHIQVTPIGEGEYYGVSLEGTNQRFLLGDFTVTHNSSSIGALVKGEKDDGNGKLRAMIARHPHEVKSGRTSDVNYHSTIMGKNRVTFVDLAGHEKYLKTTIHGLGSFLPDVVILCVDRYAHTYKMTREHIGLAIRMKIPFVICLTKTDLYTKETHDNSLALLSQVIKKSSSRIVREVHNEDDVDIAANSIHALAVVPVFRISNVTQEGQHLLIDFLSRIEPNQTQTFIHPKKFMVDRDYRIKGIGLVVSGYNGGPPITVGDKLLVNGVAESIVRSLHNDFREVVETLPTGVRGCIALRSNTIQDRIRSGSVISSEKLSLCQEMTADVEILTSHSTSITQGYQTVIHCGTVRRTAQVVTDDPKQAFVFRGGMRGTLRFKLLSPAYVEVGQSIFFREGRVIGDGKIVKVTPVE